jgi:hypothetical protein
VSPVAIEHFITVTGCMTLLRNGLHTNLSTLSTYVEDNPLPRRYPPDVLWQGVIRNTAPGGGFREIAARIFCYCVGLSCGGRP